MKIVPFSTNFINNLFTEISNSINTYRFLINEYLILNNTDYSGKNDTHIGMTYPEIVTTVKEDALHEMTLTKKSKLIQESN